MDEKFGGSFVIGTALSLLGLDEQQKAVVKAAIPDAQAAVDIISKNMATVNAFVAVINQVMPHLQRATPAAQIMVDAIAKLQHRYG